MRIAVASFVALSGLCATALASAAEASPTGIEIGVRTGYSLPLGQVTGGGNPITLNGTTYQSQPLDLSKDYTGLVPIWFDLGYRVSPQLYAGAYFQYGIAFLPSDAAGGVCGQSGVSCSGSDIMAGVNLHYHVLPGEMVDPWLGIGVGYEWANFNISESGQSVSVQIVGWQFANFQAGADFKVEPNFGLGPFVMLSLGQFDSYSSSVPGSLAGGDYQNKALHEWLTFGVRGVYDINVSGSH
jgi:hypothetical protein